jgi:hypothetical protein
MSYALVQKAVSARPVDAAAQTDFTNKELVPLLVQIRALLNSIGGDLNSINFSVGAGVPATVVTGAGVYVRTDPVSASTVLYVSFGGAWSSVTVP